MRGVNIGLRAAEDVLAKHTDDLGNPEPYRPVTTPGVYVVTTFPLGVAVSQHKPWFLKSASQFRPGPPPSLKSAVWARDYNETKTFGAVNSTVRTPEQTEIARFWATALPDVHIGIVKFPRSSSGPRSDAQRAALRRCDCRLERHRDCGFRGQVLLQFLAPHHRHPQRRS